MPISIIRVRATYLSIARSTHKKKVMSALPGFNIVVSQQKLSIGAIVQSFT